MKHRNKIILAIVIVALLSFGVRWYLENEAFSPTPKETKTAQVVTWTKNLLGIKEKEPPKPKGFDYTPPRPEDYLEPIWPPSSTIDWELRAKLPQELLDKIDQSPVPILVPSEEKYLEGATMVGTDYVFSREGNGPLTLSILAYQTTTSTIPSRWQREVRGMPASGPAGVLLTYQPGDIPDGSWDLQWRENNINYYISLRCFPSSCLGEPDVFDIAKSLRYVGGKHALGGAE